MYVLNLMLGWALSHLDQIFVIVTSATVVAVVLQILKHYKKLQEAQKTVMFLLLIFSGIGSWADEFLQLAAAGGYLQNFTAIISVAVVVHRFAVSPLDKWIVKLLQAYNQNLADAAAYRQQQTQLAAQAVQDANVSQEFRIPQ